MFKMLKYICIYLMFAQLCLTLCNPMDCSLQRSSVHGIFQARVPEWVAITFSRRSSQPRIKPGSPLYHLSHQGRWLSLMILIYILISFLLLSLIYIIIYIVAIFNRYYSLKIEKWKHSWINKNCDKSLLVYLSFKIW